MSFFEQYKNHIYMHGVVLIWGFTGILGKLITLSSVPLTWYRMLLGFLGLAAYLFMMRQPVQIKFTSLLKMLATGLLIGLHWIFFFEAIKVSNVSVTLACLSSTALFIAFLEPVFFKRKIIGYEILLGLAVIAGLYLIFQFESEYTLGIIFSITASFLAALFTVINGQMVVKHDAKTITLYEMLGGFISISVYALATSSFSLENLSLSYPDLLYLLILGIICTAFAFVVSIGVMKELSPYTVGITVNLEPIYAIILALVFFGEDEKMTAGFYFGALIILLTIFGNSFLKNRLKKTSK